MRRKLKSKRILLPDSEYQSVPVAKLINYLMEKGHKVVARGIVYGSFDQIAASAKGGSASGGKKAPLEVFEKALENAGPVLEIKTRRVGGANYQIPHEVSPERRLTLALRWLLEFARAKKGKPMSQKLAEEIIAASKNEGETIKRRENVHKMAEGNRAFAHFARTASKKPAVVRH